MFNCTVSTIFGCNSDPCVMPVERYLGRYADDTIVSFQPEDNACCFLDELRERLTTVRSTLHPEKTVRWRSADLPRRTTAGKASGDWNLRRAGLHAHLRRKQGRKVPSCGLPRRPRRPDERVEPVGAPASYRPDLAAVAAGGAASGIICHGLYKADHRRMDTACRHPPAHVPIGAGTGVSPVPTVTAR
jgi:hypothetical protein